MICNKYHTFKKRRKRRKKGKKGKKDLGGPTAPLSVLYSSICSYIWKGPPIPPLPHSTLSQPNGQLCRPVKPLRILYPTSSFSIRSIRNSLCLFALAGSEAIASASASESWLTATGEKMVSRPRTMCRSTTWVVMFAIKVFWETWFFFPQVDIDARN